LLPAGAQSDLQHECWRWLRWAVLNAATESFLGLLKRDRIYRQLYRTRAEARSDIFDCIERFHNHEKEDN
jgi:hypothetical protein